MSRTTDDVTPESEDSQVNGEVAASKAALDRVHVILVEPQGPRNVGSAARAMKNFGLSRLVLVNPPPIDHPECRGMAAGAMDVLESAAICRSLEEAVRGLDYLVGTTARRRKRVAVREPAECARDLVGRARSAKVGILFGREDDGLSKGEISLCHAVVSVETSDRYASLNLAQAVLLLAYEIFCASRVPGVTAQGDVGRLLSAEWRALLEEELFRALGKLGCMKPATQKPFRDSLRRILTAGPIQTRDARVLFALARHAQAVADPADPGATPPRKPRR